MPVLVGVCNPFRRLWQSGGLCWQRNVLKCDSSKIKSRQPRALVVAGSSVVSVPTQASHSFYRNYGFSTLHQRFAFVHLFYSYLILLTGLFPLSVQHLTVARLAPRGGLLALPETTPAMGLPSSYLQHCISVSRRRCIQSTQLAGNVLRAGVSSGLVTEIFQPIAMNQSTKML